LFDASYETFSRRCAALGFRWKFTSQREFGCPLLKPHSLLSHKRADESRSHIPLPEAVTAGPRASLDRHEQLKQIQDAGALTQDEAVLESSALMVQTLVSQLRPLLASIAEFDRKDRNGSADSQQRIRFVDRP